MLHHRFSNRPCGFCNVICFTQPSQLAGSEIIKYLCGCKVHFAEFNVDYLIKLSCKSALYVCPQCVKKIVRIHALNEHCQRLDKEVRKCVGRLEKATPKPEDLTVLSEISHQQEISCPLCEKSHDKVETVEVSVNTVKKIVEVINKHRKSSKVIFEDIGGSHDNAPSPKRLLPFCCPCSRQIKMACHFERKLEEKSSEIQTSVHNFRQLVVNSESKLAISIKLKTERSEIEEADSQGNMEMREIPCCSKNAINLSDPGRENIVRHPKEGEEATMIPQISSTFQIRSAEGIDNFGETLEEMAVNPSKGNPVTPISARRPVNLKTSSPRVVSFLLPKNHKSENNEPSTSLGTNEKGKSIQTPIESIEKSSQLPLKSPERTNCGNISEMVHLAMEQHLSDLLVPPEELDSHTMEYLSGPQFNCSTNTLSKQHFVSEIEAAEKARTLASPHPILKDPPVDNRSLAPVLFDETIPPKVNSFIERETISKTLSGINETGTSETDSTGKTVWERLMSLVDSLINLDKFKYFSEPASKAMDEKTFDCYVNVIQNTKLMDLSTIKKNLESSIYIDPWEFMSDVWLTFDNATVYNGRGTLGYDTCTELISKFEEDIDCQMKELGYCCSKSDQRKLFCQAKKEKPCRILHGDSYFVANGCVICRKCFDARSGNKIDFYPSRLDSKKVFRSKANFKEKIRRKKPLIACRCCTIKSHMLCVLHLQEIWTAGFICEKCHLEKNVDKIENPFTANRFPSNKLSSYIEERVKIFLAKANFADGEVIIRVVSSTRKTSQVRNNAKRIFKDNADFQSGFPYTAKVIFAFQVIDGVEVCFFGMHVQEYGSDCPGVNSRCVYLAYLDSVAYFSQRQLKTAVYQQILLGYMDFVKKLGFESVYIWACPPNTVGDDYIFYQHPPHQKLPSASRLYGWYKELLEVGRACNIIAGYRDMKGVNLSVNDMPYFEGDYWPEVLENVIEKLETEKSKPKSKAKRKAGPASKAKLKENQYGNHENEAMALEDKERPSECEIVQDITKEILNLATKSKENYFIVQLPTVLSKSNILDTDPEIECKFVDSRDDFLLFAKRKDYEFDTLQQAKYSTMGILYEIYRTTGSARVNILKPVDAEMKIKQKPRTETRERIIETMTNRLVHASKCRDSNSCNRPSCSTFKDMIKHGSICQRKYNRDCPFCVQLYYLGGKHGLTCKDAKCLVPYCKSTKKRVEDFTKRPKENPNNQ